MIVPSFRNAGRSLARASERRVGSRVLVSPDHDRIALSLRDRDRDELIVERPGLDRGDRPPVALERKRVLFLARDPILVRDLLGGLPQLRRSTAAASGC